MSMKRLTLAAAAAFAALAASAGAASAAASCDGTCLAGMADSYLQAAGAHDASRLPLAAKVRYTENGQELALTDGFWGTASAVGRYEIRFVDPVAGQVGVFATMRENGTLVLVGTRLKVEDRKISQIETIVVRPAGGMGGTGLESFESGAPNPLWDQVIPPSERMSRADLTRVANMYFVGLQKNDGKGVYPFTDDCNRLENSSQTTNNPNLGAATAAQPNDGSRPNAAALQVMSLGCKAQFETGFFRMVDRIRDRRFPIVDVERGVVFALVFFDHSGTVHQVTLTDGRTVPVDLKSPFTWELMEAFKIEKDKIRFIQAVLTQSPYGMKPNWPR